jgi:hypothetical protein
MTDWVPWFRNQLQASADGLVWAFSQIPPYLREDLPPDPGYLGTWPPVRYVWHITEYERCLALPSMKQWLGGPIPTGEDWPDDDEAWAKVQKRGFDALAAAFRDIRKQQIDLLDQLVQVNWQTPRETFWDLKPLSMIVTKTFQHTYEHGDTLLRMGLWWEVTLEEEAEKLKNSGI